MFSEQLEHFFGFFGVDLEEENSNIFESLFLSTSNFANFRIPGITNCMGVKLKWRPKIKGLNFLEWQQCQSSPEGCGFTKKIMPYNCKLDRTISDFLFFFLSKHKF